MKRLLILLCVLSCVIPQEYETNENDVEDGIVYTDDEYENNHKDGPGGGIDLGSILSSSDDNVTWGSLPAFTSNFSVYESPDNASIDFTSLPESNTTNLNDTWWEASLKSILKERDTPCDCWLPLNHLYFHLANFFLLLSYFSWNNIYGLLFLRVTLLIGCAFFAIWGWLILCAIDTFVWNMAFVVINFICICIICWRLKPVNLPRELNEVYEKLFKPLRVTKQQFKKTIDCIRGFEEIPAQAYFAQEDVTQVETLSLLLRGRMIATKKGRALHLINGNEFVDSAQWFSSSSDQRFPVTITALEDCKLLVWRRDRLRLTLMEDSFLKAVFDHVLGRDVVKKLTQVQDAILAMTGDELFSEKADGDEKQALIAKQVDDGPQIVAMLNKSYHGLFWNKKLPYIDDGEV